MQTTRLRDCSLRWAQDSRIAPVSFVAQNGGSQAIPASELAGPISGLWCINDSTGHRAILSDPVDASLLGQTFARTILSAGQITLAAFHGASDYTVGYDFPRHLEIKTQDLPQRGKFYERAVLPPADVPVRIHADVLVVGGGTCGAHAPMPRRAKVRRSSSWT